MNGFILCYKYKKSGSSEGSGSSSGSDLVSLGILSKPISEFSDSDIGTEVSIPYSNEGSGISGPIVFEVVGVNHHTTSEHQKTITLMTKHIIRKAAFDAKEPNNTDSNRKDKGNNRWSVSNIRQWLNSDGAAGSWWSAQHEYDAPPIAANVSDAAGAYADAPGFLAGFSADVLQHFTDITNTINLNNVDGGGTETTVDKVFLPSSTEMGYVNLTEGSQLSKFTDEASRKKTLSSGQSGAYWLRSVERSVDTELYNVKRIANISNKLYYLNNPPYSGYDGIAPIIVLH